MENDLRKWLKSSFDVNLEHLEIFNFEKTGRGVKCKRDIKANESIIKLPLECLMTVKNYVKWISEWKNYEIISILITTNCLSCF
jgi:hypothetical protein